MPEVIFPGPEGRLEGRYHPQKERDAPIAIILHPHPQFGGTMNHKVVHRMHYAFYNMGFTVLRFNFRGVGRSQGEYDQGICAAPKSPALFRCRHLRICTTFRSWHPAPHRVW